MTETKSPSGNPNKQRPKRPPTIDDVAELSGVSRSAVSRCYTPGAYVSKTTREKVRAAATALGYRPNLVARSLSTSRSNVVAVAITRLVNSFHAEILQVLSAELSQLGYRILLFMTDPQTDGDPPIDEVLRHRVDAIILCAVRFSSHFAEECQAAGVPVILLNRIAGISEVSTIAGENVHGGQTVAAFLLAGGHRRLAFIAGFDDSSTSRERERGFTDYLAAQGVERPQRAVGNFDAVQAAQACRELLSAPNPPDGIFCANDHMAIAAMDVARREFSIDIGRQLSIVGFDNSLAGQWSGIDLTTFSQAPEIMAQHAAAVLQNLLSNPGMSPVQLVVNGELIVRLSARIPKQGMSMAGAMPIWRMS